MQDEVEIIVKDDSVFDMIPGVLNDIYQEVVNEIKPPVLKTPATVDTVPGQSWTNLPSGSFGSLLFCGFADSSQANVPINIVPGLEVLMESDPGLSETGDIESVAMEGNMLWYYKQPTTIITLGVLLLKAPVALALDRDTPPDMVIPSYCHRGTLIYGAASLLWNILEEGVDGEKVNTVNYMTKYAIGKSTYGTWVGRQRKHQSRSVWWY